MGRFLLAVLFFSIASFKRIITLLFLLDYLDWDWSSGVGLFYPKIALLLLFTKNCMDLFWAAEEAVSLDLILSHINESQEQNSETQSSSCKREETPAHTVLHCFFCFVIYRVPEKKKLLKRCELFQTVFIVVICFTASAFQAKDFPGNSDFNALYTYHITPQGSYYMQWIIKHLCWW